MTPLCIPRSRVPKLVKSGKTSGKTVKYAKSGTTLNVTLMSYLMKWLKWYFFVISPDRIQGRSMSPLGIDTGA